MGERLLCKQEVIGSIPFTSTNLRCGAARLSANARRATADWSVRPAASVGRPASNEIWIGRSKLFVGQQRPAFAIFDIVKSGVTEEASADASV